MRVLILSCGTGGGHNDAARGLSQALQAAGDEPTLLNKYLSLAGQGVDKAVCDTYIGMVKTFPSGFRAAYHLGRGVSTLNRHLNIHSPVYYANGGLAPYLRKLLVKESFDAIAMTHLYPAETLTQLRREGIKLPPTFALATDYTCIPFWEETDCDWYLVPDDTTASDFLARGIDRWKLKIIGGIPAPMEYDTSFDKAQVRARLGFEPDLQYILIIGGSMGAGDLAGLIRQLRGHMDLRMRLIVVTGSNKSLYDTLKPGFARDHMVTVLGRLDSVATYMQACDLLYTKPGGLSATESVLCRVPTILLDPLSPCEQANMRYLIDHGCALAPVGVQRRAECGLELLQDEDAMEAMAEAQRRAIPVNGAKPAAGFIREMTEKDA